MRTTQHIGGIPLWEIIKHYMMLQGMNQEQLAKRMEVHSGVISDFKLGHIKKPSFELMCKFSDALGVSLDEFRTNGKEDG